MYKDVYRDNLWYLIFLPTFVVLCFQIKGEILPKTERNQRLHTTGTLLTKIDIKIKLFQQCN